MPAAKTYHRTPKPVLASAVRAFLEHGKSIRAAATAEGISRQQLARRLGQAAVEGMIDKSDVPPTSITMAKDQAKRQGHSRGWSAKLIEVEQLPSSIPLTEDLLKRRRKEWAQQDASERARRLINVKVNIKGPIGIVHFGDPHVDDPGTDIVTLEKHLNVVNATEGMFGANVGDSANNWVGRLARLYGEQSTSAAEAWALTEWLIRAVPWIYLLAGNHGIWSGAGDPVKWIAAQQGVLYESWGARLNLVFPNGKQVRINARHDFAGHSMWSPIHGASKAVQMGWRDHIAVCGHKHTTGYAILKDPSTGLISHALRVAGYKIHDRYAKELGLPNQNISPASVTIIDPRFDDDDPRLVTVIHDVETAADFLTFLRRRK